jgi:hypothetical protein
LSDHLVALVNQSIVGQSPPLKQLEEPLNLLGLPVSDRFKLLLYYEASDSCKCKDRFLLTLEEFKVARQIFVCQRKLPVG